VILGFVIQASQERHKFEQTIWLQDEILAVGGVAYWDSELYLPLFSARLYDDLQETEQIVQNFWPDLRIDTSSKTRTSRAPQRV
jgi:hypothetical protein